MQNQAMRRIQRAGVSAAFMACAWMVLVLVAAVSAPVNMPTNTTLRPALDAPAGLTVSVKNGAVVLQWQTVNGATSYAIYRGTAPGGEGNTPYFANDASPIFTNTNVASGIAYYYQVAAADANGEGPRSSEIRGGINLPVSTTSPPPAVARTSGPNLGLVLLIVFLLLLSVGSLFGWRYLNRRTPIAAQPVLHDAPTGNIPIVKSAPKKKLMDFAEPLPEIDFASEDPPTGPLEDIVARARPFVDDEPTIGLAPGVQPRAAQHARGGQAFRDRWNESLADDERADSPESSALVWPVDDPIGAPPPPYATGQYGAQAPRWPGAANGNTVRAHGNRATIAAISAGVLFALAVGAIFFAAYLTFNSPNQRQTGSLPNTTPVVSVPTNATMPTSGTPTDATATPVQTPVTDATATPIPAGQPVIAISAGGGGQGAFVADTDFNGGTPNTNATNNTIDTSAVQNPAPQAVYQAERWGDFTYTIPNLTADATYTVRLHFAEFYFQHSGQRQFNVKIQGKQVLSNFDIIKAAGGEFRAVIRSFDVQADGSGKITIIFSKGKANNAKVDGIEILQGNANA